MGYQECTSTVLQPLAWGDNVTLQAMLDAHGFGVRVYYIAPDTEAEDYALSAAKNPCPRRPPASGDNLDRRPAGLVDAAGSHLRPYLTPLALAHYGHQDLQVVCGNTSAYMSKLCAYIAKDAAPRAQGVQEMSSNFQAAPALQMHTEPGESQMVDALQHGGPMVYSCTTKNLQVRRPDELDLDAPWAAYCRRDPAEEQQSFLEWARGHRTDGPESAYTRDLMHKKRRPSARKQEERRR